ncbi:phosphopantetheine-binding protein [Streptomyces sp. NBC_01136]|uniref:phosphopantetheine-binding protein n=1 Tax=unclassified Streptomyces TaxID=2593676 RepID=UPI0032510D94|nr:phosphopantetheine-binding protein [Streptomyces sp. NBC_01136]
MAVFQGELVRALPETLRERSARPGGKTVYLDGRRAVTYEELEERRSWADTPWRRAAFADLVLHAGDTCSFAVLEDLALLSPLFLPAADEERIQVQAVLGEPDGTTARRGPVPPPLRGLLRPDRPTASPAAVAAGDEPDGTSGAWRERLTALPLPERAPALVKLIRVEVAAVLGLTGADAVDRNFTELGLDSLMSVLLRNRLSHLTGLPLVASIAYDWPNAEQLADHVYAEPGGVLPGETAAAPNESDRDRAPARPAPPARPVFSGSPAAPRSGQTTTEGLRGGHRREWLQRLEVTSITPTSRINAVR